MKKFIVAILPVLLFAVSSCNSSDQQKQKELDLKQKELELREKELELREKDRQTNKPERKTKTERVNGPAGNQKELRYLYYANGGMIGYFDDGTIVGCPKCDFCKSNILSMFNEKPTGTYIVNDDGSLWINNSERLFPKLEQNNGIDNWALVDYNWNEKVPQY